MGYINYTKQRLPKRINEFLNTEAEINSETNIHNINGKISFKNISFEYPDSGVKVLDNISFDIDVGQSVAIVGRTGSGKSTIVNLISRMYKPTSGEIEIDNLNGNQLASLRSGISLVPQEALLFSTPYTITLHLVQKKNLHNMIN